MLRVLLRLWHEQLFHQHWGCTCVMPLEHVVLQGLIVRDSQRDQIPFREVKEKFSYLLTPTPVSQVCLGTRGRSAFPAFFPIDEK